MDIFLIFLVIICSSLLLMALITCFCFFSKKIKKNTQVKKNDELFDEIVRLGYENQSKNLKSGNIKMNILTNDFEGDNELLIMQKFNKLISSNMFDELYKINGDTDLWKI